MRPPFKSQLTSHSPRKKLDCPRAGRSAAPTRRTSPTTSTPRPRTRDGSHPRGPIPSSSKSTWRSITAPRASRLQTLHILGTRFALSIFSSSTATAGARLAGGSPTLLVPRKMHWQLSKATKRRSALSRRGMAASLYLSSLLRNQIAAVLARAVTCRSFAIIVKGG
jgi:hypothetical protein